LLSGGIDSAAVLNQVAAAGFNATAVFVDYGQASAFRERSCARQISRHYGIELHDLAITGLSPPRGGEIVGRNGFLVLVAASLLERNPGIIYLGIHAGTDYYDCSVSFVESANVLLTGYTNAALSLRAPFVEWSKSDVYAYCIEHGVPLALTWSCEIQGDRECGTCRSCVDRRSVHVRA